MNGKGPRKKKAGKKAGKKGAVERRAAGGLLSRLFRGDGDGKAAKKAKAGADTGAAKKAKPLSPLERSIQEIKHMTKVGKSDPERLAMMLSKLLQAEKQKQAQAQESFDRMVWDIVRKEEAGDEDAGGGDDAAEAPPQAPPAG